MKKALLALASLVAVLGCGGGGNTYCRLDASHTCIEYDIGHHTKDNAETNCRSNNGTVVDECPVESQVGACSYGEGFTIYYYAPLTEQDGETACGLLGGTFTTL